jgi:type III secretion protein Q
MTMAASVELHPTMPAAHLPNIDAASCRAINTWLDASDTSVFDVDDTRFELAWSPLPASSLAPFAPLHVGAELSFGAHRVLVAVDGLAALNPMLVGNPFAMLPAALRDLVLQRVLARFIALLPPALANAADIRTVHWQSQTLPDWECRVGFALRRLPSGPESRGVLATPSPASLIWLHDTLSSGRSSESTARWDVPTPLRLVLGHTALESDAARSLASGDVIWVETARPSREGLEIQLVAPGSRPGWRCRLKRAQLRLVAATDQRIEPWKRATGETMNPERSTLEIPLTFDLGELTVPLQELERMQPGRLFELGQDAADATVNLRVSGQLIAEGRLVVIGRRIGVRIEHVRMRRQSDV